MTCSRMSIQISVCLSVLFFLIATVCSDSTLKGNQQECNSTITKPEGEIQTPRFPYPTSPNTTCLWKFSINVSRDTLMYLRFDKFFLHEDDVLNITLEQTIQTFTVLNKAPLTVVTSGSALVKFITGPKIFYRSFHAFYSVKECAWNLNGDYGLLSSPYYLPGISTPLPPASCTWMITVLDKQKVALSFIKFSLQNAFITIYDGPDKKPPIAANLTGIDLPADLISKEMHMMVVLNLDLKVQNVSFQAEFNSAYESCANVINVTTDTYSISPPKLDSPLKSENLFCVWILQTNTSGGNATFLINLRELQFNNLFDSLIINDGQSRYSNNVDIYVQNMTAVPDRITSKNVIYISFSSKQSFRPSNFILDLEVQVNGGNFNDKGNFSLNTTKLKGNETVIYNLKVAEDNQVEVTIHSNMSEGSQIKFYGISPNNERFNLTFFTSNDTMYPVFSTSNRMIIEAVNFTSKDSLFATFHGIPKGCDQFDLHEIGAYQLSDSVNSNCTWLIKPVTLDKNAIISLTFNTLNLGDKGTVKVFQSLAGKTSNLIQSFNSSIEYFPTIIIVPDQGVRVDTYLDNSENSNNSIVRMSAFYEVGPGCYVTDDLKSGSVKDLKSPGYPTRYSLNAKCHWSLNIPQKLTFLLHFKDVDLYPSDALSVYTVENGSLKLFYKVSEKEIPSDVLISDKNISVVWESSVSSISPNAVRGFYLKTEVLDCGENITKGSGKIYIPGEAALKLNRSLSCVWIIDVEDNQSKSGDAYIVKFEYQENGGSNHTSSSLQILDGGSLSDKVMDVNGTSSTLSRTNKIFIKYTAEKSTVPMPSYTFLFSTKACDKNHQCKNGICMHDNWRCNGENNCGDYSDEDNCNDTVVTGGVSVTIVVVLAFLAFFSGIGLTLVAPIAIRKIRAFRQRYNDFRTLPDD